MPVITIGRQIGAGGSSVGHMLATRLKLDFLDGELIDEVARRLELPKEEVEAEDEHPGSLLSRLLLALGAANTEPMIPPETSAWSPPNADPVFDTRRAVLQITQHVITEAARKRLKQTDENWTAYIKQVYGHDRTLASHYDLVLDTGRLGYDATVAAILAALPGRSSR